MALRCGLNTWSVHAVLEHAACTPRPVYHACTPGSVHATLVNVACTHGLYTWPVHMACTHDLAHASRIATTLQTASQRVCDHDAIVRMLRSWPAPAPHHGPPRRCCAEFCATAPLDSTAPPTRPAPMHAPTTRS